MAETNARNLDFEVLEPQEYSGKQDEGYSQAALSMSIMRKAIENGSLEIREGYWNTKFDRLGNAHKVWVPDTRQVLIETAATGIMIMQRDFDESTNTKIIKIKEDLDKTYKKFCEMEKEDWQRNHFLKDQLGKKGFYYREGMLSKGMPYFLEYIDEKVKSAREIISVLNELNKNLNDYKEGYYEA